MSDDLISRQALLDKLNEWDWQELYLPSHFKELIVDEVPSVQPKEKTGQWIDNTVAFYRECSECGALVTDRMEKIFLYLEDIKLNYCPNCGAKMEG